MSLRSILLRVLLSVALIFNGATTTVASVHMNHGSDAEMAVQSVPVADVADAVTESPCHQHQPSAASTAHDEHLAATPDTAKSESKQPSPDCCESGSCRCACVHHAQAAILAAVFDAMVIEHADSVRTMPSDYSPPALPHLLRPPIG